MRESSRVRRAGATWLRTGDVGRLDAQGFLTVLDRKKDMIVSGRANVHPLDVERVIARHPDVAEVTVIGVPHDRWGEAPLALIVARAGASASETELTMWANERLAKHQRVVAIGVSRELSPQCARQGAQARVTPAVLARGDESNV